MLLFLIKHSHPNHANVVRELSYCINGATLAAYNEMSRVVKFVFDTKSLCLKIEHKVEEEDWDLTVIVAWLIYREHDLYYRNHVYWECQTAGGLGYRMGLIAQAVKLSL